MSMPVTTIGVTGGRYYSNKELVYSTLDEVKDVYGPVRLAVGDANGADYLAWQWAVDRNVPYQRFIADWNTYGKMAGPIRNREILDSGVDLLIAFPGGRGTSGCIMEAEKRMIPVRVIKDES